MAGGSINIRTSGRLDDPNQPADCTGRCAHGLQRRAQYGGRIQPRLEPDVGCNRSLRCPVECQVLAQGGLSAHRWSTSDLDLKQRSYMEALMARVLQNTCVASTDYYRTLR